jgi:hypothetical protein
VVDQSEVLLFIFLSPQTMKNPREQKRDRTQLQSHIRIKPYKQTGKERAK